MRDKTMRPLRAVLSAFVATAIFLPFYLLADSSTAFFQDDATKRVDLHGNVLQLKALWEAGELERMEVIHIPTNRVYRKSVSTSTIDATFVFKLIVREPKDSKAVESLMQKIEKLEAKPLGGPVDLRWGCVFYSSNNARLFSIYFAGDGREGVADGACVGFDTDALRQWAEGNFLSAFQ